MPGYLARTAQADASRALPGRSPGRLHHVFESRCDLTPSATALECGRLRWTYAALDARANRLAHLLRDLGAGCGSRVAILLPRSPDTYLALLAVGKAGAAFVPLDPQSPPDRAGYIIGDAGADLVLTTSARAPDVRAPGRRVLALDASADLIAAAPATRPGPGPLDDTADDDPAAYVMYTSGSSGRPKGVEVAQSSICNFLGVVPELYDVRPADRVYQGMSISFDFSVEEIWPTWAAGAALVAGPAGSRQLGAELADFLDQHRITILYCVPTLLATLPRDVPSLRAILVGGEPCPAPLVERWSRPGRRMLNTYGPTEATVTATCAELLPGRQVTIGRPLPTYTVVLLDERRDPVPDGEVGEICIGGPGVARGYVGRPDLTADRFVEHPLAPPGGRLYRTGDLGRLTATGEFEYLGRSDAEVKIRGHRVDLGEIENVLLEDAGVAEAVAALTPAPGVDGPDGELAAYVVPADGRAGDEALTGRLRDRLSRRLPAYMVPSFLDVVAALPTMPSGKVDRGRLPRPTGRRLIGSGPVAPAEGSLETRLRAVWAEEFGLGPESLSVEADFFTDLGGHSLLAARIVSLLRTSEIGAGLAVRDLYANPTVRRLAAHLSSHGGLGSVRAPASRTRPGPLRHGGRAVAAAGAAQSAVVYLLLLMVTLPVSVTLYAWTTHHAGPIPGGHRPQEGWLLLPGTGTDLVGALAPAAATAYLWVRWLLPVLLVRPLSAGVRPGRHRLWGATYLRLWTTNLLLSLSPLPTLSGSPMMAAYLRLLGAEVGPATAIATADVNLPAMLRIGEGASVGYRASLHAWLVEDGWVVVAPVEVGPHAFVGNGAVLGPGARVAGHAALGDQSALTHGETVPRGGRWAGSPPNPVESLGPDVEAMLRAPAGPGSWKARHVAAAVAGLVCIEAILLATIMPSVLVIWTVVAAGGPPAAPVAVLLAGPLFVAVVCAVVAAGKRLVLPKAPAGIHPARSWLGVRKWAADKLLESSLTLTNSLYGTLYTSPWLRLLGARVGRRAEVSTAAQLDPDLLTLREESFVADMAGVGAASFARGQVALRPTEVGRRAFVGNAAVVPAGTRMGPGSLVGVGTVPPPDGVPEGTSWLGSPAMHLPVRQDSGAFPEDRTFRPPRLLVLHRLGVEFFRATLPATLLGAGLYLYLLGVHALARLLPLPVVVAAAPLVACAASLGVIGCCVACKRRLIGAYRPRVEPLWSRFVRRTEFVTGLWEAAAVPAGVALLAGTPFLPGVLRWFGARIGRRAWIATTYLTEFDLVEVGDDVAIGPGVSLQTHLFEDRVMKMSAVTVRSGSTVGARSVVLYDSVVGEDVSLGALSLLMKGERLTPGTSWRGIPAQAAAVPDM
ncbi:Pls/PosA family non-ribosomal peptide synthetase [Microbispora sp. NBC_01389]|uniref:Pls/PosA family non-ribosomal peptide synthetase n=1 Tax=Microbispora sp. NBC_01389 TaxID=2903584 RepID=UPI00325634D2